jgi:hypothetical protein
MRIAIDARKLHDFGIGTYIRNILRGLARLDPETEYIVLCRSDDMEAAAQLGANFRAVAETAKPYSLSEQFSIPLTLVRERAHLFHEPHYVLPTATRCRSVVTIHDCIHLMFPQYLPGSLAHIYARAYASPIAFSLSQKHRNATSCAFSTYRLKKSRSFTTRSTSVSSRRRTQSGWI